MANDSSTGGYLAPAASPAPLEGQSFEDFLQEIFVGITGMPGTAFFPAWQPEPVNLPAAGSDWASFRIMRRRPDTYAVVTHDSGGLGADNLQRHETVEVLVSFYGPNADSNLELLREGFQIAQNREVMQLVGMGLQETGDAIPVPSLVKEQWLYRVDLNVIFRRQILRTYPVLSLLSFQGVIHDEVEDVPINVPPS